MIASRMVLAGMLAFFGLAASLPAVSQSSVPSVSLVTYGPGQVYWERFGHNALVFRDPLSGRGTSYNYGMFDFEEADFMLNFALGRMQYQIAAEDADEEIAWYRSEGRSIHEQELNLDASQVLALKAYLDNNLLPENRRYPYDYFTSNCSTRIRDALDEVLGGALRQQLTSPSRGFTYRLLADALMSPDAALMLGIDLGLGPYSDQRLSFWQDSFVPNQLMQHLRDIRIQGPGGEAVALVRNERVLAQSRWPDPPFLPPDLRWPFFAIGIVVGGMALALRQRSAHAWARRGLATLGAGFSLFAGLAGLVMLALWFFTAHQSAWANENLLIMNPLALLLVPAWCGSVRTHWSAGRFTRVLLMVLAVLAGFALFSKILTSFEQANLAWILLTLPIHLALAHCASSRQAR
ncbi:MAG: DUF4105 domain-containing protein [Gammaproteobacteria bacterium]|nr:MAG: DUF4105 domain-containing protein [Gammaproteobacteria bacterium]